MVGEHAGQRRDWMAYVLSRVKLCSSLVDNYVAGYDILIWGGEEDMQAVEKWYT